MSSAPQSPRSLRFFCCFLLAVAVPYPGPAAAAPKPSHKAKQQIEDLEQQFRTATIAADAATMERLLADDYVGISWTGQINTKSTQIDRMRTRAAAITQMEISDLKVKVVHSVAIVTARVDVVGTSDGAPINGSFRYTRIYQRVLGGLWRITNFEATRLPSPGHDHGHKPHTADMTAPTP